MSKVAIHPVSTNQQRPASLQDLIIQENLQNRKIEPDDILLVTSGALARLIAEAKEEPPSNDWERLLDEMLPG
jgi:hypothetical protein